MVRFGTKRVETSPPFSIFKPQEKTHPETNQDGFFVNINSIKVCCVSYLLAAYSSATLSQLITLKKALI